MAKNKNKFDKNKLIKSAPNQNIPKIKLGGISKRGWKIIGIGIGTAALGFYILTFTDPAGQNWASNLSPFIILGGYAVIAIGIVFPDKKEETVQKIDPILTSQNPVSK